VKSERPCREAVGFRGVSERNPRLWIPVCGD
jgi:hypothetical protein